jgi:predicted nucleic acid-binding protein
MNVLLDTNILLRSVEPNHPMHYPAHTAVSVLVDNGESLLLVSQTLYEFWVVATRLVGSNGLGLTPTQADAVLAKFKAQFTVHDDSPSIRPAWEQLVVKHKVVGKNAHDARLVAAMIVHKIERILTFNVADFQRYTEIIAVSPFDLIKTS